MPLPTLPPRARGEELDGTYGFLGLTGGTLPASMTGTVGLVHHGGSGGGLTGGTSLPSMMGTVGLLVHHGGLGPPGFLGLPGSLGLPGVLGSPWPPWPP